MGEDKGFVSFKGKKFVSHSIDALKPYVNDILIVSNHKKYDALGYRRIEDVFPEAGPLSGLYSGLKASKTKLNVVLSCDVPLISSEIIQKLIENHTEKDDAVVCKVEDKWMPLVALYKRDCAAYCLQMLQNNQRRMMDFLKNINQVRSLPLKGLEANQLKNINTKKELNAITNED